MIATVNLQYILLDYSAATGYRVKRRTGAGAPPVYLTQTDQPLAENWSSNPAPSTVEYAGRQFQFIFWSMTGRDSTSSQADAQIQTAAVANDSHVGGVWTLSAKAYYIPAPGDGGGNGGDHNIYLDAFDVTLGDFIPDDFVDVQPDAAGQLTSDANNGDIDTSTEIQASPVTIVARDQLANLLGSSKQFGWWQAFPSAAVGQPNRHDITASHNEDLFAIAFYTDIQSAAVLPGFGGAFYNPWWAFETHGGLVPPGPGPQWMTELIAAVALARTTGTFAPQLRPRALQLVAQQLQIAAKTIEKTAETRG